MKRVNAIFLITAIGIGIFIYSGIFFDISRTELEQKYASEPSRFLKMSDGKIIHYRDEGNLDLPVIVFLHGFNGSLFNFERLTPLLSGEFRIVSLDLPGFGLTGAIPSKNYSNESFMDTVNEVVDHLNITNFSIAGNSMGGGVAWRYTLSYPEKINSLILLASSSILRKEERKNIEAQSRQTPWVWKLMRSDLTNFVDKAIKLQKAKFRIYNCTYGKSFKVIEIIKKMIKSYNQDIRINYDLTKPSIPVNILVDSSRARKELGWKPKTNLNEGLNKTFIWYKNNKNYFSKVSKKDITTRLGKK